MKEAVTWFVPKGLIGVILGALVAALLGWFGQWTSHVENTLTQHTAANAKTEAQFDHVQKSLDTMGGALIRIEDKIDRNARRGR